MYRYRLYGLSIVSDLYFPQLVEETADMEGAPEIYVGVCEVPESIKHISDKKYDFGATFSWLSNLTTWLIVENGNRIGYRLKEGGKVQALRNFILGFGMSMIAAQRGILSIHCSAVADGDGAVLIAGESGAGKSTLTTAFLERGYHLMADDMAFVETVDKKLTYAYPAFPFQKLCRNVAIEKGYNLDDLIYINEDKDKFMVPYQGEFGLEKIPVKAFIMLGLTNNEEVEIKEIAGFDKFIVYANNLFLRHLLRERKYNPEFGQLCIEMAANVPTYRIARPIEGDSTKQVAEEAFRIAGTVRK
ncbi:MAG: hypothetical protein E7261_02240 [Lachnospiraceae bacterium]|nr:hypothetical protein [Lachnospiraceae bacterium]